MTITRDNLKIVKDALAELSELVDGTIGRLPSPDDRAYFPNVNCNSGAPVPVRLWDERLRRMTFLVNYTRELMGIDVGRIRKDATRGVIDFLKQRAHRGDPFRTAIDDLEITLLSSSNNLLEP